MRQQNLAPGHEQPQGQDSEEPAEQKPHPRRQAAKRCEIHSIHDESFLY
jgi:hypothetical protein